MTYRLSTRAEADLTDIWIYSAVQWGTNQADVYVDDLLRRLVWLSANPSFWKSRPDIAEGIFSYPQQSHVIYFRQRSEAAGFLEIVRVLHGRMEPSAHV